MSTEKLTLTRKEIASMLNVSCDQVRKSEARWGILKARCDLSKRCIRYRSAFVLRVFQSKGWI